MAIFKNFYINLDENMTISAYTGSSDINQSSNLAQYFGVKLKDWALEEGCFLYITFEREHNGVTFKVEPILMPYNMQFEAYTIIVPPEVIALAGNWTYSIEKRNYAYLSTNDTDDITDDTPYSSLTTAKAILTIKQSVVRSRDDNAAITEVELRILVDNFEKNKAAMEVLESSIKESTETFEGLYLKIAEILNPENYIDRTSNQTIAGQKDFAKLRAVDPEYANHITEYTPQGAKVWDNDGTGYTHYREGYIEHNFEETGTFRLYFPNKNGTLATTKDLEEKLLNSVYFEEI